MNKKVKMRLKRQGDRTQLGRREGVKRKVIGVEQWENEMRAV